MFQACQVHREKEGIEKDSEEKEYVQDLNKAHFMYV